MLKKKTTENQSKRKLNQVHSMSERLKYRNMKDKEIRKLKYDYRISFFTNILLLSFIIVISYHIAVNNDRISRTIDLNNFLLSAKSDKISELGMDVADQETNNRFLSERLIASETELNHYMKEYERCVNDYLQLYDFEARYMENDFGFLDIAKNVSESHTYDVYNYNCVDFSNDYVNNARKAGYMARTFHVRVNCKTEMFSVGCAAFKSNSHMIAVVSLPIEPQSGKIIPVEEYDDYGIDRDIL
jgi:hypothetical protein